MRYHKTLRGNQKVRRQTHEKTEKIKVYSFKVFLSHRLILPKSWITLLALTGGEVCFKLRQKPVWTLFPFNNVIIETIEKKLKKNEMSMLSFQQYIE